MLALVAATAEVVVGLQRLVHDPHFKLEKTQNDFKQLSTSNRAMLTSVAQKVYSCLATVTSSQISSDISAEAPECWTVLIYQPSLNSSVSAIMSRGGVPESRDIEMRIAIYFPAARVIM